MSGLGRQPLDGAILVVLVVVYPDIRKSARLRKILSHKKYD